jgi:hypothetical protein
MIALANTVNVHPTLLEAYFCTASQRFMTVSNFAAVALMASTSAAVGVVSARSTMPYSVEIALYTSVSVGGFSA